MGSTRPVNQGKGTGWGKPAKQKLLSDQSKYIQSMAQFALHTPDQRGKTKQQQPAEPPKSRR
jgi:hypothetical protein